MVTMKHLSNVGIRNRIRQVLILLIIIILGILISHSVGARSFQKASYKPNVTVLATK